MLYILVLSTIGSGKKNYYLTVNLLSPVYICTDTDILTCVAIMISLILYLKLVPICKNPNVYQTFYFNGEIMDAFYVYSTEGGHIK